MRTICVTFSAVAPVQKISIYEVRFTIFFGQAVLSFAGTIEYFRDTVFNYPTLAEAYKVAALDGLNKL